MAVRPKNNRRMPPVGSKTSTSSDRPATLPICTDFTRPQTVTTALS